MSRPTRLLVRVLSLVLTPFAAAAFLITVAALVELPLPQPNHPSPFFSLAHVMAAIVVIIVSVGGLMRLRHQGESWRAMFRRTRHQREAQLVAGAWSYPKSGRYAVLECGGLSEQSRLEARTIQVGDPAWCFTHHGPLHLGARHESKVLELYATYFAAKDAAERRGTMTEYVDQQLR